MSLPHLTRGAKRHASSRRAPGSEGLPWPDPMSPPPAPLAVRRPQSLARQQAGRFESLALRSFCASSVSIVCAIDVEGLVPTGVPEGLRAYTGRACARFGCRGERPTQTHPHASDNGLCRAPLEICMVHPNAFWPRSAGWKASRRCYADVSPSSFFACAAAESTYTGVRH